MVQLHVRPLLARGITQRQVQPRVASVEVKVGTSIVVANHVSEHFDNGCLSEGNRFSNEIAIRLSVRRTSTFCVGLIVRCHALHLRHNHDVQVAPTSPASKLTA